MAMHPFFGHGLLESGVVDVEGTNPTGKKTKCELLSAATECDDVEDGNDKSS